MIRCPSCARQQEPQLICRDCGSPLALEVDYFAALGFPRRLTLGASQLERAYHERGRLLHPDRFAVESQAIREASLASTALLTRSYRTLRDPVSRGRYWLELRGEKLAEDNKRVPTDIAALVFEVQEELAELRDSIASNRSASEKLVTAIRERRQTLQSSLDEELKQLEKNFAEWDGQAADSAGLTQNLKATLSIIAYLRTLIRDVDRELQPLTPVEYRAL
jgi:molecular chaperone HscB